MVVSTAGSEEVVVQSPQVSVEVTTAGWEVVEVEVQSAQVTGVEAELEEVLTTATGVVLVVVAVQSAQLPVEEVVVDSGSAGVGCPGKLDVSQTVLAANHQTTLTSRQAVRGNNGDRTAIRAWSP